jgi:glucan biosynthesis protein C
MTGTPPPAQGGRIFYLDSIRAFAMFYGIFVHGSTIGHPVVEQTPLFYWIQESSDLFRNAMFFLVSGFFTALVWKRSTLSSFAENRFNVLVVPLVASMILIAPFTNWLVHSWHNGPMTFLAYLSGGYRSPTVGNDTWALHIWFLYVLVIYAVLTPLLYAIVSSEAFTRAIDGYLARTKGFTHWTNVLIVAVLITLCRAAYDQVFRHLFDGTLMAWIGRASFNFLAFFLLGVVAFTHRRFLDTLVKLSVPGLLLFLLAHYAVIAFGADLPRAIERALYWVTRAGLMLFIITGLMWAFHRWANKPTKLLSYAVDSAYSFYLFHFTFIYLCAFLARQFTDNLVWQFWIVVATALPATLLFHSLVISRFALTRRLFMGKPPKPAGAPQPAA